MGKLVQVKPGFFSVFLPTGKAYSAGQRVLLTDAQFDALESSWAARVLTILKDNIPDYPVPERDASADLIPERLCIYYGIPANVLLMFDPVRAAQTFAGWDLLVFGDGLQEPSNPNHASTRQVMQLIKLYNPNAKIFGYVSLALGNGDSAPLTEAQMKARVDGWAEMGADGMILDEFGREYLVTRARQNLMLDYVHSLDMIAMVNVWNIDDAFSSAVDATYNPLGLPTTAREGDYLLLESWIVNTESYPAPEHNADIYNIKARADKARAYRSILGVKWLGSSVVNYAAPGQTDADRVKYFKETEDFGRMFAANGWGVDALAYASGGDAGNIAVVKLWEYDLTPIDQSVTVTVSGGDLTLTRLSQPDLRMVGTSVAPGASVWTTSDPL